MYYKRRKTRERNRCISLNLLVVDYEFDAHMIGVSQLRPEKRRVEKDIREAFEGEKEMFRRAAERMAQADKEQQEEWFRATRPDREAPKAKPEGSKSNFHESPMKWQKGGNECLKQSDWAHKRCLHRQCAVKSLKGMLPWAV